MSVVYSVPENLVELTKLVEAGDLPAAKKLGKTLLNKADMRALWLIARIAKLLENRPHGAVDLLRAWWESAPTEADRAIIAACAPKDGEQRHRPQASNDRAPRWNGRNNYQAPSTVQTRRQDAADLRTRRRARQEAADAAAFRRYKGERGGVADGPQLDTREDRERAEQVYASGFDYDRAALHGTDVPFRCLSCSISRSRYDLNRDRIKAGHGDDGLCGECRERGYPGIPELANGHSVADAVNARCAFLCAELGAVAARVALQTEWKQAKGRGAIQAAISDYAFTHFPAKDADELPAATAGVAPCTGCPEARTAHDLRAVGEDDGLCAECRAADAENAAANAVADEVAAHRAAARAAVARAAADDAAAKYEAADAAHDAAMAAVFAAPDEDLAEAEADADAAAIAVAEAEAAALRAADAAEDARIEAEEAAVKAADTEAAAMLAEIDEMDAAEIAAAAQVAESAAA
ncbi:hypothetical protein NQK81_01195 [Amycolatopsis roodepoortensis]|uniref:hypothetical protein n=1 Tax=Amycolatopsis roodepoortensis TaxID=700274 RepID=UPI00214BF00E|nr:hypothetical protein [Amycolatopsis roodepoortensis]UUV32090.1 hypothetical protein NQK81_01195 [Amycolatopsis roodepoortensis]